MHCSKCGAWSEVLDTRTRDGGHRVERRRRCANGHTFATVELHVAVYCSAKQRQRKYLATIGRRVAVWERHQTVRRLRAAGKPARQIAAEVGLGVSAVFRVLQA